MIELLVVTIILLVWSIICLGIGHRILRALKWESTNAIQHSIAYLLGFGSLAYSLVLLGLFRLFNLPTILIVSVVYALLFGRTGVQQLVQLVKTGCNFIHTSWGQSRRLLLPLLISASLILVNYLANFAPPTARDEISYHLPEANAIMATQSLDLISDSTNFYTSIPMLLEVVYAFAILISGYALAHALHYSLWLAFCLFMFGWLKQYFGQTTAAWSIVGLFLLTQIVTTATSGLVDSGFMVLEIISLCLVIDWLHRKQLTTLGLAGAMLGLALSIKYSPLFTAGFLTMLIAVSNRKAWLKSLTWFVLPAVLFGGFWYIKNLVVHHNPTYPLLFGHSGYGEAEYLSLVAAIQDFVVPRTLWNYLQIPKTFYLSWTTGDQPLLSLAYDPQTVLVLLSMLSLPWLLLINKHRRVVIMLASYMIAFSLYWFFVATHQVRFLDTATIVLVILAVISITQLKPTWRWVALGLLVTVAIGTAVKYNIASYSPVQLAYASVAKRVLRADELNYIFGRIDRGTYLAPNFGCGVAALDYLETQDPTAKVLDNWTVWHDHQFKFYDERGRFISLPADLPATDVTSFMHNNSIDYIYFDSVSKTDFATSSDPFLDEHYRARVAQEQQLLDTATLEFESATCQLYKISP